MLKKQNFKLYILYLIYKSIYFINKIFIYINIYMSKYLFYLLINTLFYYII